jgi:hypothetical protein
MPILAAALLAVSGFDGSQQPGRASPAGGAIRPFEAGERATYDVRINLLFSVTVGTASLEVVGVDTVRGRPAWHVALSVHGSALGYKLRDSLNSWVDTTRAFSLRFTQNGEEKGKPRRKWYDIFPERATYAEQGMPEQPSVRDPLDELSFLYFVRTLSLEVDSVYTFDRHFKPATNPVRLKVLRRESIDTPWGKVKAIVVQPIIRSAKFFSEDAKAQVWFADDSSRTIVQIKTGLPIGSVTMRLRTYRPSAGAPVKAGR